MLSVNSYGLGLIMHEMGIAMQIMEVATASLPDGMADATVERINLRVGKLSAVVPESLRFCFEIASQETPFQGAELNIEEIPVVVGCRDCLTRRTLDEPVFICQNCNSGAVDIISGRELDIESIEIADGDAPNVDNI